MTPEVRREAVRAVFTRRGFDAVHVASAAQLDGTGLRSWLAEGHQADMAWMERSVDKRLDPGRVLPGVRTILALGVNSLPGREPAVPLFARYARHEDYHDALGKALRAACAEADALLGAGPDDSRAYVDTGPVLERAWAARAGMGFIGKNGVLISRIHGNWLLLAAVLHRAELPPDPPLTRRPGDPGAVGLLCGTCTRCLDACPTRAFPRPGVLDARRCISYHTIENRGPIPEELRPLFGQRVFGCDVCLEVCPWNRFARAGRGLLLRAREELDRVDLADLLGLDEARYRELFRRMPQKRAKLEGLLRNACVAAGNSGRLDLVPALERLAQHASALVREHAAWALGRLRGP